MSRPQRIEYPGAFYHVMNRGRSRKKIFHDAEYYQAFLATLEEAHSRFGLVIHAYCLMSNHYHLLVSTPQGNLQRAMRHVGGVYTQRYNKLFNSDGSLFRGRYKAILVDSDEYLLHLSKYIHLNPLEARMVDRPDSYPWSSYPSYIGTRKPHSWLAQKEVYDQLSGVRFKQRRYREFVEELPLAEEVQSFYRKKRQPPVLGDKSFLDAIKDQIDLDHKDVVRREKVVCRVGLDEIVQLVADKYDCEIEKILVPAKGRGAKNLPRKVAMYIAQVEQDYKLTEIARYFGLNHYGGVSSAVHAVKMLSKKDNRLVRDIKHIINRFDP